MTSWDELADQPWLDDDGWGSGNNPEEGWKWIDELDNDSLERRDA